jgi:hypothetical protein
MDFSIGGFLIGRTPICIGGVRFKNHGVTSIIPNETSIRFVGSFGSGTSLKQLLLRKSPMIS